MGGGNASGLTRICTRSGLSPRGRGKLCSSVSKRPPVRSIPAWAGETVHDRGQLAGRGVYPRVGGGNLLDMPLAASRLGLSPRGRGKPSAPPLSPKSDRSIPAWAGETPRCRIRSRRCPVYPRVGGGNAIGASPSWRRAGLSPRGRGKLGAQARWGNRARSIPAWAGETGGISPQRVEPRVYPRVGGGNAYGIELVSRAAGLSPRGRGKL